jgi:hypothetical protein
MGHSLATDIATIILVILSTCAVVIPITIALVLQLQKNHEKIYNKFFGVFAKDIEKK